MKFLISIILVALSVGATAAEKLPKDLEKMLDSLQSDLNKADATYNKALESAKSKALRALASAEKSATRKGDFFLMGQIATLQDEVNAMKSSADFPHGVSPWVLVDPKIGGPPAAWMYGPLPSNLKDAAIVNGHQQESVAGITAQKIVKNDMFFIPKSVNQTYYLVFPIKMADKTDVLVSYSGNESYSFTSNIVVTLRGREIVNNGSITLNKGEYLLIAKITTGSHLGGDKDYWINLNVTGAHMRVWAEPKEEANDLLGNPNK